jgi:hypothetical protein
MNTQEIEKLIAKFEKGETSIEEEKLLKSYFATDDIPEHLAIYGEIFSFYGDAMNEELPDPEFDKKVLEKIGISNEKMKRPGMYRKLYPYFAVAASLVILIGLYFLVQHQGTDNGTYDDPELAYAETKKILMEVSGNLNTGFEELSKVKTLNTGMDELQNIKKFDDGMKSLGKISILDKSKQMVIQ